MRAIISNENIHIALVLYLMKNIHIPMILYVHMHQVLYKTNIIDIPRISQIPTNKT